MKKIYIAGKITGECETPELMRTCLEKFDNYSILHGDFNKSETICNSYVFIDDGRFFHYRGFLYTYGLYINRLLIPIAKELKVGWKDYMKNDISTMVMCDEVHFLPDYTESKGAKIELQIAIALDMKIIFA